MSTLVTRISDLATRVATEFKSVRAAIAAIVPGAPINDNATATTTTYSSSKITALVNAAITNLTNGAPGALDQLNELAAALGNDANFSATVTNALANRVRYDAAQTLTLAQKAQAKSNIDAYGAAEIGNPDTDLVAIFNAGLV